MPDNDKAPESPAANDDLRASLDDAFTDFDPTTPEAALGVSPTEPEQKTEPVGKEESEAKPEGEDEGAKVDAKGRLHDEKGRFAKKEGEPEKAEGAPAASEGQEQPEGKEPDKAAETEKTEEPTKVEGAPPPGWSPKSKAAWETIPDHIRADIVKREKEVNDGFAALRDYKDLKPYAEQAKQSGTTLSAALQRYTTMEQTLRRDPAQGLMAVAQNTGLSKSQAAEMFANLAQRLGGTNPNSAASPSKGNAAQPATNGSDQNDPLAEVINPILQQQLQSVLGPVTNELSTLKSHLTRQQEADQNARQQAIAEAIEEFAADPKHRYFSDLEETISRLFETGIVEHTANPRRDLEKAYEQALWMHPEVRETLINERLTQQESTAKAAAEKAEADKRAKAEAARKAAVSVRGAPGGTTAPAPGSKGSVRDDLNEAFSDW